MERIFSSPFLSCMFTKLMHFLFKISHTYLAVYELLAQIGIVDSDLCSFVRERKGTLLLRSHNWVHFAIGYSVLLP